ncbi:MAG TPA: hypothetical protein VFX21_11750 [Acidimicrobiia bacterium]|nr:hypothetical protein [Acidimicrobiia bacterium]
MLGLEERPSADIPVIRPVKRSSGPVIGLALGLVVVLIAGVWFVTNRDDKSAIETKRDDAIAKSDLRNALVAAKVYYTDTETYADVTTEVLSDIEPSLTYASIENTAEDVVGFGDLSANKIVLVTKSAGGTYYCVAEDARYGTTFGESDSLAEVDTVAECHNGWDGSSSSSGAAMPPTTVSAEEYPVDAAQVMRCSMEAGTVTTALDAYRARYGTEFAKNSTELVEALIAADFLAAEPKYGTDENPPTTGTWSYDDTTGHITNMC